MTESSVAAQIAGTPVPADSRNKHLDALRGLAIVLVVVGHAMDIGYGPRGFDLGHALIYSFHIPLLAFLSGWATIYSRSSGLKSIGGRFRTLMVPYLFWLVAFSAADAAKARSLSLWFDLIRAGLLDPFARNGLWFLYVLFICSVVFTLVRARWSSTRALVISAFVVSVLSLILLPWPSNWFGLARVGFLYPFLVGGFLIADKIETLRQHRRKVMAYSVVAYVLSAVWFWHGALATVWPTATALRWMTFPNAGVSQSVVTLAGFVCAASAILVVTLLVSAVPVRYFQVHGVPVWLGQRSIGIYATHFRLMLAVSVSAAFAPLLGTDLGVIVLALCGLAFGSLAVWVLERTPFAIVALGAKTWIRGGIAHLRLDLVVVALLVWLPLESWALKFTANGSALLVVADVVCMTLALLVLTHTALTRGMRGVGRLLGSWAILPGLILVGAVAASGLLNSIPVGTALYWGRGFVRFVPLAAVALTDPWSSRIRAQLPYVAATALAFQIHVGVLELLFGRSAALFFWPGTFTLGRISTAVQTLSGVEGRYVAGTTGHYNILAWYLILAASVLVGFLASGESRVPTWLRRLMTAEIVIAGGLLVLTQSKQAFIVLVCILPLLVWYLMKHSAVFRTVVESVRLKFKSLATVIKVALAVVVVGALLGTLIVASPVVTTLGRRYATLASRDYWRVTADNRGYAFAEIIPVVAKSAPLLGWGPGSFDAAWEIDLQRPSIAVKRGGLNPHHARYISDTGWANVFSQTGLLGLLAFLPLIIGLAVAMVRTRRIPSVAVPAGGALIVLALGMIATNSLTYKPTSSLLWVIAGLTYAYLRDAASLEVDGASEPSSDVAEGPVSRVPVVGDRLRSFLAPTRQDGA